MKVRDRVMGFLSLAVDGAVTVSYTTILALTILLVILRYFFHTSIASGYEIIEYLFIYTTFLGAGVLLGKRGGHVEIRLLVDKLPISIRRIVDIVNCLLVTALHGYLLCLSFEWIRMTGDYPAEVLRVPMKFVEISLPVGCGLAIIYEFNNILDSLLKKSV